MENQRENLCKLDLSDAIIFSVKNFNKIPAILNIGTELIILLKITIKKYPK